MNPSQDITNGQPVNHVGISGGRSETGRVHVFNQFQHIKVGTNAGRAQPGGSLGAAGANGVCPNHTLTLDGVQDLSGTAGNETAVQNFRFEENGSVHQETVSESQGADVSLLFSPMAAVHTVVPSPVAQVATPQPAPPPGPTPVMPLESMVRLEAAPETNLIPYEATADEDSSASEWLTFDMLFPHLDPEVRYTLINKATPEDRLHMLCLLPTEEFEIVANRLLAEYSETHVQLVN